jgi:dihydrofolate synthase/folylpolyglutamate synthase
VDPLAFLHSLETLGMKFGLENISRLCAELGHPERAFRSIHIAGTNGKGSVTAMTETALRAAGYRAARYTSPHLVRLEERFVIDGREVATTDLVAALGRVQAGVERLVGRGELDGPPTFFECATAAAFELFRRFAVDLAVLEVGLGGRLDATNVVTPIATAITSIDFDHQAQLGSTLGSIAAEKAGIIKPRVPVVCGPLRAEAAAVIDRVAEAAGAPLVRAPDAVSVTWQPGGRVAFRSRVHCLNGVKLALPGLHQVENAAVVLALLAELDRLGVRVGEDAARAGLVDVTWPGRIEHINTGDAEILLDAAHNPAGARALAAYLEHIGWTDVTLVFGAMRDKEVGAMLRSLAPSCARVICTMAHSPRAMAAAGLADIARQAAGWTVEVEANPAEASAAARRRGGRIVIAGSIFLIGPLRDILR